MLSCFDYSTIMAQPWADAGFTCYCVDIKHPHGESRQGNIVRVHGDMKNWTPPNGIQFSFAAFFPPCTNLAASGSRWFKGKGLMLLSEAIHLVAVSAEIAESLNCPYLIENPIGTLSTYWRKPDFKFDPCDYGDPYTKKTCLWTGGGFLMPEKNRVNPIEGSKMHRLPPSEDRQELRSVTPEGFARAVFQANRNTKRTQEILKGITI